MKKLFILAIIITCYTPGAYAASCPANCPSETSFTPQTDGTYRMGQCVTKGSTFARCNYMCQAGYYVYSTTTKTDPFGAQYAEVDACWPCPTEADQCNQTTVTCNIGYYLETNIETRGGTTTYEYGCTRCPSYRKVTGTGGLGTGGVTTTTAYGLTTPNATDITDCFIMIDEEVLDGSGIFKIVNGICPYDDSPIQVVPGT